MKVNGAWSEFNQYCKTERVQATDLLQLYMDNLKSGTYYRIELRAHNAMGYSETRALKLKTARGELQSDSYDAVPFEAGFAFSSSSSSTTTGSSLVHVPAAVATTIATLFVLLSLLKSRVWLSST